VNRSELRRYLGVTGHTLGHVEKDYLQHIVLAAYSRSLAGLLVFKGGTALQKRGVVSRFSEDLDFTMAGEVDMPGLEGTAVQALDAYTYPAVADSEKEDARGMSFRLRIEGPLFGGDPVTLSSLRVEVSRRELVLLPTSVDEIAPPYAGVMPYVLASMDLREVLAEKVRAMATRSRARDLYDLAQLTARGVTTGRDLVDRKMDWYGRTLDTARVLEGAQRLRRGWDRELGSLMERVPPFDDALSALEVLLDYLDRDAASDTSWSERVQD
jgi:predicted nucleotidyltransferase component of viral defense system